MKREDLAGRKFGKLTVLEIAPSTKGETKWLCSCDCGASCAIYTKALKRGLSQSCGCSKERHQASYTAEYAAYRRMIQRCTNQKNADWHLYGGRGIRVEFDSFAAFLQAVGPRPGKTHSIDRIDSDGHYSALNVKWSSAKEQANNLRCNRLITAFGRTMTISQWGEHTTLGRQVIEKRIDLLRWSVEDALSKPLRRKT